MGDFDAPGYRGELRKPSDMQFGALAIATGWSQSVFSFGDEGIFGHEHFGKAQCPGYAISDEIRAYRRMAPTFQSVVEWQKALLKWNPRCLPGWGADGFWGNESKKALVTFQRKMNIQVTGIRDIFTELMLMRVTNAR
jgi:hypothetical protein